jgi:putative phosphotransacetylase
MKTAKLKVNEYNSDEIERISKRFNLSKTSSIILLNRNIKSFDDIEQFLDPDFKYFESAENYKDLHKGCLRVLEAIKDKDRILIYGDYDVDGITSISQFVVLLRRAGADVDYYIPERESEGYGISSDFVNNVIRGAIDFDLLITVDCGISEVEKIAEITRLNKDVIIVDHHECREVLPDAYAIINPKQKDCPSKNKHLCAAGLSFKFLIHLNKFLKIEEIEDVLLEYACLGTVADIVDLIKDNRIIAYQGLKRINETKVLGIKKLIEVLGIKDRTIKGVRILGPARKETQVEISLSDGFTLGLEDVPVRDSGKIDGTPGLKLVGPKGEVVLDKGVIAAARHLHMHTSDAEKYGLKDKDLVQVKVGGPRGLVFDNVLVRVNDEYALDMHVDIEEGNAAGLKNGDEIEVIIL